VSLGRIQFGGQRLTGLLLQTQLETGQRPRLPLLQPVDLDPDFTRNRVERLATSSRNTTSRFRLALHRWPGAKPPDPIAAASVPTPVALRALERSDGLASGAALPVSALALGVRRADSTRPAVTGGG